MTAGYVITFDNSISASAVPELIVQRIRRPFVPNVRDVYVEVPGRDSAWLFTEEPGDSTLEMDVTLLGATATSRRASVRKLAGFLTKRSGRKQLIINDEPDRFWWAKLADSVDVIEAVTTGRTTIKMRTGPFAEALATSQQTVVGSGSVTVIGDPEVRMAPILEVTTTAAAATGWEFTLNGVQIGVTDNLGSGVTRTVSTVSATIVTGANADSEFASGVFPVANLAMQHAYGDFGYLVAGANPIVVTRGSLSIRVVWRRRYV